MGLAASQSRFLSLSNRQHTIETRALMLMSNKRRLAVETDAVYKDYILALDSTKIKSIQYNTETGKTSWVDGSIYNLMRYQAAASTTGTAFFVQDKSSGRIYVDRDIANAFNNTLKEFIISESQKEGYNITDLNIDDNGDISDIKVNNGTSIEPNTPDHYRIMQAIASYMKTFNNTNEFIKKMNEITQDITFSNGVVQQEASNMYRASYYIEMFNAIKAGGGCIVTSDETCKKPEWVSNMIKNGEVILTMWDNEAEMLSKTSSVLNSDLREVTDDSAVEVAAQDYETALNVIHDKDAEYDKKLAKLESEREAIVTELEGLKEVMKNNVEVHFKVFS